MPARNFSPGLDFSEYLAYEQAAETRHELVAGEYRAMTGATEAHVKIAGNVFAQLWQHLRDAPCAVYASDMKLKAGPDCYYPDVFVSCAAEDNHALVKEQPVLVVEVLSNSTESLDKGRKLLNYLNIKTLEEYVLINQDKIKMLFYRKTPTGWELEILRDSGIARLASVKLELPVTELYAKVSF